MFRWTNNLGERSSTNVTDGNWTVILKIKKTHFLEQLKNTNEMSR